MVEMVIPPEVPFKPFEEEIIRLWKEGSPEAPWLFGSAIVSPKAHFIKGYMLEEGAAYVKQLWEAWSEFCDRAAEVDVHFRRGSYQRMAVYVWLLKKLGLIRAVRRAPGVRRGYFERVYYAVVKARIDHPAWRRPTQALYPSADWTLMSTEKKREARRRAKEKKRKMKRLT